MPVYADLGVKRVINAWGPMTIIGSALVRPEVIAAMAEAAESYVDVIELQRAAGKRLAELIGVEACYVAAGSAAGLAIVTAALMTGGDQARVAQLPAPTSGMRDEVIMQRSHRNPYDHAFRQVGARIVEIGHAWSAFDWELEAAIGPKTSAVVYVYGHRTMHLALSLPDTVSIAHGRGVPVIVDAAAEVPPARNLRALKDTGADVVVISGGKGLRGPQNSAIVQASPDIVEACIPNAAPLHSHGRSMKTTKEDIIGLLKAVELFTDLDHDAVQRGWRDEAAAVVARLEGLAGVRVSVGEAGYSEAIPVARVDIDGAVAGRSAAEVAAELAADDPSIRVTHDRDWLTVNPQFLQAGESEMVAARLRQALGG